MWTHLCFAANKLKSLCSVVYCQNVVSVEHPIYLALVLLIRLALSRNYSAVVSGTNKDLDFQSKIDFQSNQVGNELFHRYAFS